MTQDRFVPDDFVVPVGFTGDGFHLELLRPEHNEADHAAWMSSIEHIRGTAGLEQRGARRPPA